MNMFRADIGEIRKVTIVKEGNIWNGFSYTVGQEYNAGKSKVKLTRIVRHEHEYHLTGELIYAIYGEVVDGNGREFLWHYFANVPVRVECFIPKEDKSR